MLGTGAAVLLAGGITWWSWDRPGHEAQAITCSSLFEDKRVVKALGESRGGHDCAQLSSGLKEVTMGEEPGEHSLKQAQATRDIMLVLGERLDDGGSKSIEQSLRVPLAEILADYVSDTHEIFKDLDVEYARHELPGKGPWKDSFGVHMSVPPESLLRVMRAVSEDPTAYAAIRMAESHYSAKILTGTPRDADEIVMNVRACGNAPAFGALDAISSDITSRLPNEKSDSWESQMAESVTSSMGTVPKYGKDPAGYVVGTWVKSLQSKANVSAVLRNQSTAMLQIWTKNREASFKLPEGLASDCKTDASRKYREVTRFFKDGTLESRY